MRAALRGGGDGGRHVPRSLLRQLKCGLPEPTAGRERSAVRCDAGSAAGVAPASRRRRSDVVVVEASQTRADARPDRPGEGRRHRYKSLRYSERTGDWNAVGSATHRKGLREAASRGEVPNGVPPDFRRGHDEWYAYVRREGVRGMRIRNFDRGGCRWWRCRSGTSRPPRELGAGGFDAKHHWGVRRRRGVVVIVDDDR